VQLVAGKPHGMAAAISVLASDEDHMIGLRVFNLKRAGPAL
jgi:hypothetical protein